MDPIKYVTIHPLICHLLQASNDEEVGISMATVDLYANDIIFK